MKKIVFIMVTVLIYSSLSLAGTKEDLAKEVLKTTDIRMMSEQVVSQVLLRQTAKMELITIPADRIPEEKALYDKMRKILTNAMGWEKLEVEYGKFLAEVYTEEELTALLNFSRSPVGQSIIKKEPVILGKIMLMMQTRVQTVLPEIQKMTRDFSETVKRIK